MKVEVRPLPVKKWHGKKDEESFAEPKAWEVTVDPETGKYRTGLTPKEAEDYGKMMGVDLSDDFSFTDPHPYFSSKPAWLVLPNHTLILDTEKAVDFVKVKNMKASPKVANSMTEWEAGKFPNATHVIYDEAEEVAEKATKIELRDKAKEQLFKLSQEDKINVVRLLSQRSVKGMSPNFITVEIEDIIETKPKEFLALVKLGREEVTLRAKVNQLVASNILTKEGGAYFYMGEPIAMNFEDTVDWFQDPQNSKMKIMILEKLGE